MQAIFEDVIARLRTPTTADVQNAARMLGANPGYIPTLINARMNYQPLFSGFNTAIISPTDDYRQSEMAFAATVQGLNPNAWIAFVAALRQYVQQQHQQQLHQQQLQQQQLQEQQQQYAQQQQQQQQQQLQQQQLQQQQLQQQQLQLQQQQRPPQPNIFARPQQQQPQQAQRQQQTQRQQPQQTQPAQQPQQPYDPEDPVLHEIGANGNWYRHDGHAWVDTGRRPNGGGYKGHKKSMRKYCRRKSIHRRKKSIHKKCK